ncbi:MAG: CoA pyrophosphatase [Eubacteriales bacterium]|jgi:coenzyme A diphosphatase NUDT7|nr:CoA pyrophosphatase [Eubacteriales bacterium]
MNRAFFEKLKDRQLRINGYENLKKFGVLVPLTCINNEYHLIFQVRSDNISTQPGEISFPGGGREPGDKTIIETAIRETQEEFGLSRDKINVLAHLDTLITPYNIVIRPFVAEILDYDKIIPNESEVKEVFTVPLSFFTENDPEEYFIDIQAKINPEKKFPTHWVDTDYNWRVGKYSVLFYQYENRIIWGFTAKIIENLVKIIKNPS